MGEDIAVLDVTASQRAATSALLQALAAVNSDHLDNILVVASDHRRSKAYKEAGIDKPREQVSMFECHDCFSITEMVTMEDLFLSSEGGVIKDVMDGFYDADGQIPCQIDGGLKCFGHPIGASGIRMLYEMYLQLLGRAGERQLSNPSIGMTHNLGGSPMSNVAAVCIIGAG